METTSGSLFFLSELRALSCLYLLLLKYTETERVFACVFLCIRVYIFAVCVCIRCVCMFEWVKVSSSLNQTPHYVSVYSMSTKGLACFCICISVLFDIKSNCDSSALDDSSSLLHKISRTNRQPGTDKMKSSVSQKENTNSEVKNNFQTHIYVSY